MDPAIVLGSLSLIGVIITAGFALVKGRETDSATRTAGQASATATQTESNYQAQDRYIGRLEGQIKILDDNVFKLVKDLGGEHEANETCKVELARAHARIAVLEAQAAR